MIIYEAMVMYAGYDSQNTHNRFLKAYESLRMMHRRAVDGNAEGQAKCLKGTKMINTRLVSNAYNPVGKDNSL